MSPDRFAALWRSLAPIGRDADTNRYLRYSLTPTDLACREWFVEEALDRDLTVETDGNGNMYAWWGDPATGGAVLTGSHLDSVPHGGGYDGPLGVVSALLAIDVLRGNGMRAPSRAIGVAVFVEEEGARFGVPCLGSRLATGAIEPATALALHDRDGISLSDALSGAGLDPAAVGADTARLDRIATFVELHIEQGRGLVDLDAPVGVATGIWPHARWRLDVVGEGNHAGTTQMADRHDPMLTVAFTALAANKDARLRNAHATVGRVSVEPNATNAVASRASAWLDLRAPDQSTLDALLDAITRRVAERADRDGVTAAWTVESRSPLVTFDPALRERLVTVLGGVPVLATAAGHDAAVLSQRVPTAMVFVRNPTGVSHAPAEYATDADCAAGVNALAKVLADLVGDERDEPLLV